MNAGRSKRDALKLEESKAYQAVQYWLKQRKQALNGIGEYDVMICDSRIDELCQKIQDIRLKIYQAG